MAMDNQAMAGVVGGNAHRDPVADDDADVEFPHLAGNLRVNDVAVIQFHRVVSTGEGVRYSALYLGQIFF